MLYKFNQDPADSLQVLVVIAKVWKNTKITIFWRNSRESKGSENEMEQPKVIKKNNLLLRSGLKLTMI